MSEAPQPQTSPFKPHIAIIAAIVVVIVLAILFFPSDEPEVVQPEPVPVAIEPVIEAEPEPVVVAEPEPAPVLDSIATEEIEIPAPVQEAEIVEEQAPIVVEEIIEAPEPAAPEEKDVSDGTIKSLILALSPSNVLGHLLVDDGLLNRFVVFTDNLAQEELADNHQLLRQPTNKFRVYQQADKEWIDAASYRRYTVYSEALESISAEGLVNLYQDYKPEIQAIYDEISIGSDFDDTLLAAIDHILDTPEIPVPVAVETESVMYQFADRQIENLSAPQKQLLRTGPENMRTIKAKLRDIAALLK